MNLDDIIKGFGFGGKATATFATLQGGKEEKEENVAKVADVAVATQQKKTRYWFVTEPGRESFEVHCSPPASMSEVLDGRPDGTMATPCEQKPVEAFSPPEINIEPWRDRLWAQLDENSALNYAIEVALPNDESPDIEICVARRGVGTFTLLVPRGTMTPMEGQLKILELCREWTDLGCHT
ncbi:hypothetical protein [Ferrovum sp.]|uniref:hypothetical protein n=1 Tax=Ferrovum sp. TaxID=2609467 RepID=UPI002622716F|nr:hypothetical protein [Ferrovum sp.]